MTKNENLLSIKWPNLRGTPQNKTTSFMLASIELDSRTVPFKLLSYLGFINCYLSHKESLESYPDTITIVFNPTNEAIGRFAEFYEIYRNYHNYVDDYILDFNLIAVVFKVQDRWKESLGYFKDSKYSKISRHYAELLKRTDFRTGKTHLSQEYKIIHKDKDYKLKLEASLSNYHEDRDLNSPVVIDDSSELMGPLDPEKETFSYEYTE